MLIFVVFFNSPPPNAYLDLPFICYSKYFFTNLYQNQRSQYKQLNIKVWVIKYEKNMWKTWKKTIYLYYCTLEIHNVFVLACLYSLFNIYYKHIIFRSSIPSLIQAWLPPSLIRYPGHSQPSLLLRPLRPLFIWHARLCNEKDLPWIYKQIRPLIAEKRSI